MLLPYTKIWLAALKLGYSRKDLCVMPYSEVLFDLAAHNDMGSTKHEQDADVAVTEATQEDIRTMLG